MRAEVERENRARSAARRRGQPWPDDGPVRVGRDVRTRTRPRVFGYHDCGMVRFPRLRRERGRW
jgi:hypothetical protein